MKPTLQKQINDERKILKGVDPEELENKVVKVVKESPAELAVKYIGKALRFILTLGAFFLACIGLFTLIFPTVRHPLWTELKTAITQIFNFIS